ncbi:hypothetical protein EW026_g7313 [Hermanssonia centrifuga]|uniref:O-methyltransferase C-terminal domain-containing protein n=1 Tax=Hermanssonia centrifuga TaxID=98765 RepID=A0A4S4K8C0_9APHY|nr:hypothetical protein EW026_g7313 [Hermanssonia centrifuga]
MDANITELDALQRTLNHAIDTFRRELAAAKLPPLSLNATKPHPLDDCTYLPPPRLYEARRLALASIGQLKSLLQFPFEKVVEEAYGVYDQACLDVMIHTGLVECLAGASDRQKGLHVSEIQKALDIDSRKLTIILRYLSTGCWVRETDEGVFTLNRPSLELLQGTNGRRFLSNPHGPGLASALVEWLQHPEWKYSDSVTHTPVQIVHKTDLPIFDWLKTRPDDLFLVAEGIRSFGDAHVRGVIADYPWGSLEGQTVVDCGGGQGSLAVQLAKSFPDLRFIIQDLPEVVVLAKANIDSQLPAAQVEGQVLAETQDFFTPQTRKDMIGPMLTLNIADAAGPKSKLIIIETVSVPGISQGPNTLGPQIMGLDTLNDDAYQPVSPPPFIPANLGGLEETRRIRWIPDHKGVSLAS